DRILRFLPREIRGPIIASWGIRGRKAAMRDDDHRVRAVLHDAFVAGDIDDQTFEDGITADVVVGWGEVADWWKFWRGGKHTKYSIQRALESAYELGLFDARWFFDILESGGGKLHGTDVLVEGMSKTELSEGPLGGARVGDAGREDVERRAALGDRFVRAKERPGEGPVQGGRRGAGR